MTLAKARGIRSRSVRGAPTTTADVSASSEGAPPNMPAATPPTNLVQDARAPAEARRALDSVAAELSQEQLSDARILVNELVTNSVRHAGPGVIELMLELTATHLVIAVTDAGAVAVPVVVHDGFEAAVPHGWGLRLVESLSESWGVRDDAAGRRTVWCEVRRVAAL